MGFAYYASLRGGDMISVEQHWSRSDTIDVAWVRRSRDHGHSWTPAVEMRTGERRPEGMLRRHPHPGFVDRLGRLVEFRTLGAWMSRQSSGSRMAGC